MIDAVVVSHHRDVSKWRSLRNGQYPAIVR
jgi:hypothetical protein